MALATKENKYQVSMTKEKQDLILTSTEVGFQTKRWYIKQGFIYFNK